MTFRRAAVGCGLGALALLVMIACAGLLLRTLARRDVDVQTDVPYGEAGGQVLLLDVYRPKGREEVLPAVLLIHGGGWRRGSKADNAPFARHLARAGFVCFCVNYRLVTEDGNRYPAQLDDVQRAVRWIRAHAAEHGIDPDRVGAFGHSAGAHLAALLGTRETRDNSDPTLASFSSRVNCVVDTCGPTDFRDRGAPPLFPAHLHLLSGLFGKTRAEAPDLYRDASPVAHVSKRSAPFLILHGTADSYVPLEQPRRLRDALRKAGVEVTLLELEDGHLFQARENQQRWLDETTAFFRKHLARPVAKKGN
jgi:acetyl esterase/lipase